MSCFTVVLQDGSHARLGHVILFSLFSFRVVFKDHIEEYTRQAVFVFLKALFPYQDCFSKATLGIRFVFE